jgi:hypothetical protein
MWKVIGGSIVGKLHVQKGKGCEDSSAWLADDDFLCLIVADGAGSRSHSASGSRIAVATALDYFADVSVDPPTQGVLDLIEPFRRARDAVESVADSDGVSQREYATTLAMAVIVGDLLTIAQIGDGIVVVRHGNGAITSVAPPGRSEYINETVFLTSSDWEASFRQDSLSVGDITALALSTDGLQFKILEDIRTGAPYGPFFEDIFAYASTTDSTSDAVVRFIDDLDDQTGDDKTLLVAVLGVDTAKTSPGIDCTVSREGTDEPEPSPLSDSET